MRGELQRRLGCGWVRSGAPLLPAPHLGGKGDGTPTITLCRPPALALATAGDPEPLNPNPCRTYADRALWLCRKCSRGFYASRFGATQCSPCPVDTFAPLPGAFACIPWWASGGAEGWGLGHVRHWTARLFWALVRSACLPWPLLPPFGPQACPAAPFSQPPVPTHPQPCSPNPQPRPAPQTQPSRLHDARHQGAEHVHFQRGAVRRAARRAARRACAPTRQRQTRAGGARTAAGGTRMARCLYCGFRLVTTVLLPARRRQNQSGGWTHRLYRGRPATLKRSTAHSGEQGGALSPPLGSRQFACRARFATHICTRARAKTGYRTLPLCALARRRQTSKTEPMHLGQGVSEYSKNSTVALKPVYAVGEGCVWGFEM